MSSLDDFSKICANRETEETDHSYINNIEISEGSNEFFFGPLNRVIYEDEKEELRKDPSVCWEEDDIDEFLKNIQDLTDSLNGDRRAQRFAHDKVYEEELGFIDNNKRALLSGDIGYLRMPVYDYYKNRPFFSFRSEPSDTPGMDWDFDKMIDEHRTALIHQKVQYCEKEDSQTLCTRFLLKLESGLFVYGQGSDDFDQVLVMVYAETQERVCAVYEEIKKRYLKKREWKRWSAVKIKPFFFLLEIGKNETKKRIVESGKRFSLTDRDLRLHYGNSLLEWETELVEKWLKTESGLTLLQGPPGTGKTSYLRHLVSKLNKKIRFYYLPLTSFPLFFSPQMVPFWADEIKENPKQRTVVIIEDAESILMKRAGDNREQVGDLLNLSDGLGGNFMKMHIVCTINAELEELDSALLRPGRLAGFRKFDRLAPDQARAIAEAKGLTLAEQPDYSLAEIYGGKSVEETRTETPKIGF